MLAKQQKVMSDMLLLSARLGVLLTGLSRSGFGAACWPLGLCVTAAWSGYECEDWTLCRT
jgi:hypothetical protein